MTPAGLLAIAAALVWVGRVFDNRLREIAQSINSSRTIYRGYDYGFTVPDTGGQTAPEATNNRKDRT